MLEIENLRQLTEREIEILQLLAGGLGNQHIADPLCITVRTVKFHTNNIYSKLVVRSRAEARAWAWKQGIVSQSASDD